MSPQPLSRLTRDTDKETEAREGQDLLEVTQLSRSRSRVRNHVSGVPGVPCLPDPEILRWP